MDRILESELMNGEQQAQAYAKADFSATNQWFVDELARFHPKMKTVLDLGCGSADIPLRLIKQNSKLKITAIDGSEAMLAQAKKKVKNHEHQIALVKAFFPGFKAKDKYDAIISNSLLHHLHDVDAFWKEIKRIAVKGTVIFMMDIFRPESKEKAREIVENVSQNEDPILKKDFYNSLLAAFTVDEIKQQLAKVGLNLDVSKVSERHMLVKGIIV